MKTMFCLLLMLFCSLSSAPQSLVVQVEGQSEKNISFQEKGDNALYLRVIDDSLRAVEDVNREMIKVVKNGKETKIISVNPLKTVEDVAQRIVLVIDNSSSMSKDVDILLVSIESFLNNLSKATEVSLILFEEKIDPTGAAAVRMDGRLLKLRQLPFTNDFPRLMDYCRNRIHVSLTRKTYLHDAVLLALQTISEQPAELQRSIVILSDGEDTGSTFPLERVIQHISGIDYRIYAVDFSRGKKANQALAQMIKAANGKLFEAKRPDELVFYFADISKQITTLYLVTYKIPSPPTASIRFLGDSLTIRIDRILDEAPLLNYVFFDSASAELSPDYLVLEEPEDADEFDETAIAQPMDKYYHLLNIIGARMRQIPECNVTITGCNSDLDGEKKNLELSKARAQTVAAYLREVFGIDSTRMVIEARNLPLKPSGSRTPEGVAENRRAEITCSDERVMRPVKSVLIDYLFTPPVGEFEVNVRADDGLREWQFRASANDSLLFSAIMAAYPAGPFFWNWLNEQGKPIENIDKIDYRVLVSDREGAVFETPAAYIPVTQERREDMARSTEGEMIVERYSLILFDFDSATFGKKNMEMLDKVKASFGAHQNARIDIYGFTDTIGDESYNEKLAKKRAQGVFDELRRMGVPKEKMTVIAKGENDPPYENDLPEGRFLNRTVQIYVSYPEPPAEETRTEE